jgi:argininosuccinate lyase
MSAILRGGRLTATRPDVVNFISSLSADKRIALSTVLVNEAHIVALERCGAIKKPVARKILRAVHTLEKHVFTNRRAEDIHVLIEESVIRRTGEEVGGLLHLGKSRNDQVVTAIRMTLRSEILDLANVMLAFELSLVGLSRKYVTFVFPGYTHLQPAQPISFGHYLVANCFSFIRDSERLLEAYARVNLSPMGAGALAGTSFPLDRALIARLLGFDGTVEASLDAVAARDFALESLAVFALTATDLSRISFDLLFYSSSDVELINIPDEFASTSSIMPQKKNLDPLELIRAKSGRVAANLDTALNLMHGLTSGYNLDYQEITPLLWQSVDELKSCLGILTALLPKITPAKGIAARACLQFTAATEIANLLVRTENLSFRTAHQKVGSLVKTAIRQGKSLHEMGPADWERVLGFRLNPKTFNAIAHALNLDYHINIYRTAGSPNPRETRRLIAQAQRRCGELAREHRRKTGKLELSSRLLRRAMTST